MAVIWDGTLIRCDAPTCVTNERVPAWVAIEDDDQRDRWLVGRAWKSVAGRHYCPECW